MYTLSDQLRDIVLIQDASPYTIAKHAMVDKASMSRFVNGGTISLRSLERIAGVLGCRLVPTQSVPPATLGRPKQ